MFVKQRMKKKITLIKNRSSLARASAFQNERQMRKTKEDASMGVALSPVLARRTNAMPVNELNEG